MADAVRLDAEHINQALTSLAPWELRDGKLYIEVKFEDFNEAWRFMAGVALIAEAHNHHPEWFNVWNTVRVWLSTHDVGGISNLDVDMARRINAVLG